MTRSLQGDSGSVMFCRAEGLWEKKKEEIPCWQTPGRDRGGGGAYFHEGGGTLTGLGGCMDCSYTFYQMSAVVIVIIPRW